MRSSLLNNRKINGWVFWPPFILFFGAAIYSLVAYESFTTAVTNAFYWTIDRFGWLFVSTAFTILVLMFAILLSKGGTTKIGQKDAKPIMSTFNWFAISLCAGIGTGIVFWGAAEPIIHFSSPPESLGIAPFSTEAAYFAMSTVYLHWSFTPYALYILIGIPIALAYHNYNQPLLVSSSLYFLIGEKCQGAVGKVIDAVCIYALCGAMATSLGAGLMQIGSGLNIVFHIPTGTVTWGIIAIVITICYTISSYTGLDKGIRWLSSQNTKLFIFMLIFVFIVGPTQFILDFGVDSMGDFMRTFIQKSFFLSAIDEDPWPGWWSIYYWANWMAFCPIVGLFLARISKGRTIRQFILVNLIAPALFGIIWFAVFGCSAIYAQMHNISDLAGNISNFGTESAIFNFFDTLPLGTIFSVIFLISIIVSFVTLADSMTSSIASMSVVQDITENRERTEEAPAVLKVLWGVIIGIISWVMITYAGVEGFKMISNLAGFPIMFLLIAVMFSTAKGIWYPNSKPLSFKFKKNKNKPAETPEPKQE